MGVQTDGRIVAVGRNLGGVGIGQSHLLAARYEAEDPCASRSNASPSGTPKPTLLFGTQQGSGPGRGRLRFAADFRLPEGVPFGSFDPLRNGALVQLTSAAGLVRLGVKLPAGAFSAATRRGWLPFGTSGVHLYRDLAATPPGGIASLLIVDRSQGGPGLVHVDVKGARSGYPVEMGDFPLTARVVLGGPAPPHKGVCAEVRFHAEDCRFGATSAQVFCRG